MAILVKKKPMTNTIQAYFLIYLKHPKNQKYFKRQNLKLEFLF